MIFISQAYCPEKMHNSLQAMIENQTGYSTGWDKHKEFDYSTFIQGIKHWIKILPVCQTPICHAAQSHCTQWVSSPRVSVTSHTNQSQRVLKDKTGSGTNKVTIHS